ncbi:MAG: cytochrome c biogenesis protein ResB, partial [Bacteroidetes bacterium]|nr:cytochrome c biogenesis protein ResB [Bacteroidota bacterium]
YRFVKHPAVKWLSSTPAAIASISVFTILVLLMGFIPQKDADASGFLLSTGLNHVTRSWAYLLSSLFLLVVLGFTIIRRFLPFSIKNLAFFLNHGGLWVVVVSASLGSADLWRLSLPVQEQGVSFTAYDAGNNAYRLPFAVKLIDFDIEEYPPRLGLMRNSDGTLMMKKGDKLFEVEEGSEGQLNEWKLFVVSYYTDSRRDSLRYSPDTTAGSAPSALILAMNSETRDTVLGWVSSGSFRMPPAYMNLNDEVSLAMLQPGPKKYSSKIRIYESMEHYEEFLVEVNKPVKFKGWKIYQVGYNERMGKWSTLSILELVKDPWLPVVYTGIFMILTGSLYLVWMGRSKKPE